jgi:hypothetical protein
VILFAIDVMVVCKSSSMTGCLWFFLRDFWREEVAWAIALFHICERWLSVWEHKNKCSIFSSVEWQSGHVVKEE